MVSNYSTTQRAWPNGPKGRWLTGNLTDFSGDPLGFLENCVREYGDFVPIRFFKKPVVIINDTDDIEKLLTTEYRNFEKMKGYSNPFTGRLFGNGLLTSDGETWVRQRRMAQPAFRRKRISAYAPVIVDLAEEMLSRWKCGETRSIHEDLTKLTGQVVIKALFNTKVPPEVDALEDAFIDALESMARKQTFLSMFRRFLPTPGVQRFGAVIDGLDTFVYRLIAERRASGKDEGDILSMLVEARDDEGNRMSDQQLRDEMTTLLMAGLDTTVLSLSWACYLLARHPDVADELRDEIQAVLGERRPQLEDLASLKLTVAILKEAMRLYPPAWIMTREAVADCSIGGYPIARGTGIIFSQWLKHRDARVFDQPDQFNPSRWLEKPPRHKFAYFPFGGGPRLCIGNGFATMEAPLGLASICQKFRFECEPGYVVDPWPSITLQPKGGIHLKLRSVA